MDLRQLRYFLAVAERLHFTRAADHLGITQPPLTQQIHKLEQEIGAPLFRRLGRGVQLTAAGRALQADARRLLAAADQALLNAQAAASGHSGRIRLGFASSAVFHPRIAMLLRAFRLNYPRVDLAPLESDSPALMAAVINDRLDAAFVRLPSNNNELHFEPVAREPLRLVLPATHRLSQAEAISVADVAREPLILAPPWTSTALYEAILGVFRQAGFEPLLGQQAPQVSSCPNLVASGFGISLIPQSICQVRTTDVSYHPLSGQSPLISIVLATRRNELSPTVINLVGLVRDALHNPSPLPRPQ